MGKRNNVSKKLEPSKFMPPKYHGIPGVNYNTKESEVIKWLIRNPSILEFLWDHVKQSGLVKYDSHTGKRGCL